MTSLIRLTLLYPCLGCLLLGAGKQAELDQYWAKVSEAVRTGNIEAYRATCHPDGVLVSGGNSESELLSQALIRWGKEFADTRAGKMEARVEFRFGDRILGKDTAHETGIFLYSSRRKGEEWKKAYVHFEALRHSTSHHQPPAPCRRGSRLPPPPLKCRIWKSLL